MAAVDYSGNTIRVTAAGSTDAAMPELVIRTATVWWATTAGDLSITAVDSASSIILRLSPDASGLAPFSEWVGLVGRYGRLSFNTVTACTLFLQVE